MQLSIDFSQLRLTADAAEPTGKDFDRLVDYLFAHRKMHIQDFLAAHNVPRSGTKTELRERLLEALQSGTFRTADLVTLLDRIEGWGNQHVYLYRPSEAEARRWKRKSHVEDVLRRHHRLGVLNQRRPLVLPEKVRLSSIYWTVERVRFVWVEGRTWEDRLVDKDFEKGEVVYHAYQRRTERAVTQFDWDLISREAALLIRRLPSGTDYGHERERFVAELEPLMGLSNFEAVRPSRAVGKIEGSGEAKRRQLAHETLAGSRATFTSRGRDRDAFEKDPDLLNARRALGDRTIPVLGNFYWHPVKARLSREMHLKVYGGAEQRVGVFGEFTEPEVMYVLSRVRHHCR